MQYHDRISHTIATPSAGKPPESLQEATQPQEVQQQEMARKP